MPKNDYKIQYIPINRARANPDNPRTLKSDAFKRLVKSLSECPDLFDARPCICSDRTGELIILGGNMRHRAAQELKYKQIPVIIMQGLTEAQEREIAIKDNGEFGEWDFDALANSWADLPLVDWGVPMPKDTTTEVSADAEPATNEATELNKKWGVSPGDLWAIGPHLLYCGDSTNDKSVKRAMGGAEPMLMVTDPPYGVEYDASWREQAGLAGQGIAKGKVTNDNRSKWCGTYIRSGAPVAYIWHADRHAKEVAIDLEAAGYDIRSQIIWVKKKFAISRGDYHWGHEPCWYAVKKGEIGGYAGGRKQSTLWADISDQFDSKSEDQLYAVQIDETNILAFPASATTVWTLKNDKACGGGHSTQKPLECMARPIRNHGEPGDIVYDPFLGSGTTMVACQNLNRKCRGIEISPEYCAVILQRMADAFPGIEITREK